MCVYLVVCSSWPTIQKPVATSRDMFLQGAHTIMSTAKQLNIVNSRTPKPF